MKYILKFLPRKFLIKYSFLITPILRIIFRGKKYTDPIDDSNYSKFLSYGYKTVRKNALCPGTLSLERHRLLWLYLDRETNFLNSNLMDLIFTDLNSNNKKIEKTKFSNKPICIIIGPEGDFSEHERQEILSFKGVQALKINDNILRSETAVISAISIINYVIN